ncbi:MAG: T9SS type A sorting domain-containing protein [Flavobacteriales bacterium]|nr:T9SS type A sorting domain-containing protein [Flavobacteriales bacterium]
MKNINIHFSNRDRNDMNGPIVRFYWIIVVMLLNTNPGKLIAQESYGIQKLTEHMVFSKFDFQTTKTDSLNVLPNLDYVTYNEKSSVIHKDSSSYIFLGRENSILKVYVLDLLTGHLDHNPLVQSNPIFRLIQSDIHDEIYGLKLNGSSYGITKLNPFTGNTVDLSNFNDLSIILGSTISFNRNEFIFTGRYSNDYPGFRLFRFNLSSNTLTHDSLILNYPEVVAGIENNEVDDKIYFIKFDGTSCYYASVDPSNKINTINDLDTLDYSSIEFGSTEFDQQSQTYNFRGSYHTDPPNTIRYFILDSGTGNIISDSLVSSIDKDLKLLKINNNSTASVNEPDLIKVELYPNPTSDVINVKYALNEHLALDIRILDLNGRLVKSYKTTQKQFEFTIDEESGVYVIEVFSKNKLLCRKKILKIDNSK